MILLLTGASEKVVADMLKEVSMALFEEQTRGFTPKLANSRNWIFHEISFPIIDCQFTGDGMHGLRIKMDCSDWDERPPSIELLTPEGSALPTNEVPAGTGVYNQSPHKSTQKPFVCMRGSFEYHTHPSHINDPWSQFRGSSAYTLGEILSQLWNAWKKDRKNAAA